jgi:hypothetical protein
MSQDVRGKKLIKITIAPLYLLARFLEKKRREKKTEDPENTNI